MPDFKKHTAAALLLISAAVASAERPEALRWDIRMSADLGSGDHNPFWLANNRQGLGSPKPNSGFFTAGLFKDSDPDSDFTWEAGLELAATVGNTAPFLIQQLYGQLDYRCLSLFAGAKEQWSRFVDPSLSSGDLIHSGNARPIPQLRAGIFDYADIWGLAGWLAVKGYVAYGKFTDSKWERSWTAPDLRYSGGVLYCSRALWIRNGNPDRFPLTLECGIELDTQFGGTCYNVGRPGDNFTMPHNLKAFFKAFVPMHGDSSTDWGEQANIQGNMLGAWNFALDFAPLESDWNARLYYQHMFEDHSMLYIDYPWKDGMFGLEITLPENPVVTKGVIEYLNHKWQSGPLNWTVTPEIPGNAAGADNYYNNYIYPGWQHWGMGIGNPLSLSPLYNDPHRLEFLSNRIRAFHFGLTGSPTADIDWRLLFSSISSWGSYEFPLADVTHQYSGLAEISWYPSGKLDGWSGSFAVAFDGGSLVGKNIGVGITISRTGLINL